MPMPTVRGTLRAIRVLWTVYRWEPYTPGMSRDTAADPSTGAVVVAIAVGTTVGTVAVR